MAYSINNITYVPDTDTIQAVVKFQHNGKNVHAVVSYETAVYPALTYDVKALQNTATFIAMVEAEIAARKIIIDTPEV